MKTYGLKTNFPKKTIIHKKKLFPYFTTYTTKQYTLTENVYSKKMSQIKWINLKKKKNIEHFFHFFTFKQKEKKYFLLVQFLIIYSSLNGV